MVTAYWEVCEQIYKACVESDRAGYGKKLLEFLSAQLTAEFGKGFDVSNLRNMRRFYMTFPIRETLSPELSWSHYVKLMKIPDETARNFYAEECAKSAWSVRQLERQIHTMYYQRIPFTFKICHTHKLRFLTYNLSNYGIIISNSTPQTCYRKTQKSLSVFSTGETFCFILPIR